MIAREKFGDEVYSLLFPSGNIPLSQRGSIGAMDARITEIYNLATGEPIKRGALRIIDPAESQELSRRIVELRDSQNPPISWRDIARELGGVISADAVRCRYQDAKNYRKREGAGSEPSATPEQAEATIREFRAVEKSEEVPAGESLQEAKPELPESPATPEAKPKRKTWNVTGARKLTSSERAKQIGPKIPHSEDEWIFAEKEAGRSFPEITQTLCQRGIDCSLSDVQNRYYQERAKRKNAASKTPEPAPEAPKEPERETLRNVAEDGFGPLSDQAREPEDKPAPRSISRPELDLKMWGLHKQGKTCDEISQILHREGLPYSAETVHRRLIQQGAQL
jgi:hypothetical protein